MAIPSNALHSVNTANKDPILMPLDFSGPMKYYESIAF